MALNLIKLAGNIRKELSKKLDPKLIKQRDTGQKEKNPATGRWEDKTLSYISANTCIDLLNKAFGHNWSMRIVDHWMEPGYTQVVKQKKDWKTGALSWPNNTNPPEDKVQTDAAGNKFIELEQGPSAWCIVELSVNFVDDNGHVYTVTKQGFGSQSITGGQSTQAQNGYKGAQSDALKKAATLFGIALELYRDPSEEEHFLETNADLFNVWTDELKEQYAEQFKYIDGICILNGYEVSDLAYWVGLASEYAASSLNEMDPVYMDELIELLRNDEDLTQP